MDQRDLEPPQPHLYSTVVFKLKQLQAHQRHKENAKMKQVKDSHRFDGRDAF